MAEIAPGTRKVCRGCARRLPAQRGPGRPRLYCEECRPTGEGAATPIRPHLDSVPSLASATREALVSADRLGTAAGVLVMNMAATIDEGGHSGSSLAALSREYRAALADALSNASVEDAEAEDVWKIG